MIDRRHVLVAFLAITFITLIVFGFADQLKPNTCEIARIDNCARTGGLSR